MCFNCFARRGAVVNSPAIQAMRSVSAINIKEKVSVLEAISAIAGQEIEMANEYRVYDAQSGRQIFVALEATSCWKRQLKSCLPECSAWDVDVLHTAGGRRDEAFRLERPWTCTCFCCNRPRVGITESLSGEEMGTITDSFACCGQMTFKVEDPSGTDVLYAHSGCCQLGLYCPCPYGPCSKLDFVLTDASSGEELASMHKKIPGCCKWCFAPDVDDYHVDFGAMQDPQHKVLLMALAIFIDFRYFNDNSWDDRESGEDLERGEAAAGTAWKALEALGGGAAE